MDAMSFEVPKPVGDVGGYVQENVNTRLTPNQGRALRMLVEALRDSGAEQAPRAGEVRGRRVEDGAGAVRWMLEQYARMMEGGRQGQ